MKLWVKCARKAAKIPNFIKIKAKNNAPTKKGTILTRRKHTSIFL